MKKVFICLLAICIGYIANAQIQTKFWGLELSKRYTSLTAAKSIISDRCAYSRIDGNNIEASDGTLGGYDWGTVVFNFSQDNTLYSAGFASEHDYLYEAKNKCQQLLNSLTAKYGEPTFDRTDVTEGYVEYKTWLDESGKYYCILAIPNPTIEDTTWYVTLIYTDLELFSQLREQQEDEL